MPISEILSFDDPYPYQRSIRAADVQLFPTAKGTFRAELTKITLSRLWAQKACENLPRVFTGTLGHGRAVIGFLADAAQPPMQHRGIEVPPGVIIVNDKQPMHRRSEAACRWGSMSLTPEHLNAATQALTGRELIMPSITHLIRPPPILMSRLVSLHQLLSTLAKTSPEMLAPPEVARALEHDLVHLMVRCLTGSGPLPLSDGQRHHSRIMARFEDYLSQNLLEPIYLAEICAATGASERVLRICCEEHLGMGPVRYLWMRRMHLARRALTQGPSKSVTQVATDHGFWELGRFATEYRRLFGESPSVTLRKNLVSPSH